MHRLERDDFVRYPFLSLWGLLAFQAGFVNAFGFQACGRYVSHVTGFGTQIGIAIAERQPYFALELAGLPLSFIFGAFASAFLTSARIERGLRPKYARVMAAFPAMLLALIVAGELGAFGPFGEPLVRTRDFALLFSLSFLCGAQNGCFATLTKGQIRTTHLTGISTDIGTDFARLCFGRLTANERELTIRTNTSRIATLVAFAAGSVFSVYACRTFGYAALFVPLLTSSAAFVAVRAVAQFLRRRIADTDFAENVRSA